MDSYGYQLDPVTKEIFKKNRKTHNDGVFDAYTEDMRKARHTGIITGLPDAYGRGRIIGDYRRVALYGVDRLIKAKEGERKQLEMEYMESPVIRLREEVSEQIKALKDLKTMAESYGYDISKPASNAREAIQWTYFAYLGAIKEQDGAAMSLVPYLLSLIFILKRFKEGILTEEQARTNGSFCYETKDKIQNPSYNDLFWRPYLGRIHRRYGEDGRTLVTKSSFRILHTLNN